MMMVDRISDLPDELLSHILSFLPTKLAFSTTVLSKRWTGICYSLPALHFEFCLENCGLSEQQVEDTFYRFSHFVDTLILSHLSTNKPLKTFLLICPFGKGEQYSHIFSAWFEAAKQCRVEEINLDMDFHTLNPITFISQSLVVLKLKDLYIGNDTSCVDLPSLKILHLSYVYFENQNDYIGFLSACPNLEHLHAVTVRSRKPGRNNTSEGLKSLALPKLVGASIDMADADLNLIKNVKFLRVILYLEDSIEVIQVFSNLIHIDLLITQYSSQNHNWDQVVQLLCHSPKLQILSIKKSKSTTLSKEWKCPSSVIECVSSHLRSCTILNLQGSENDLRFTKYILQNASLLQNMKISITTSSTWKKSRIQEVLTCWPRISLGCKLSFE